MHVKFNFYFSVDKTQRFLTAAIDADLQKWYLFLNRLHTQRYQVCRDCILTQYRHCSVVKEIKLAGESESTLSLLLQVSIVLNMTVNEFSAFFFFVIIAIKKLFIKCYNLYAQVPFPTFCSGWQAVSKCYTSERCYCIQ